LKAALSPLRVLAVVAVLLAVTAVILSKTQSPYYILNPDPAHPVAPLVHVADQKPPVGNGTLYFVDVTVGPASRLQQFFQWLGFNSHSSLVPASEFLPPGSSNSSFIQAEARQMTESETTAAAVALRQLHYPVVIRPNGVIVNQIVERTDAAGKLQPSDVIVAINGVRTPTITKLHSVIDKLTPGQIATLRIKRGAKRLVEAVKTTNVRGHALVGFAPAQSARIKLPMKISIDAGDIGGPSAGLAFTLEVMKQLGANVTHGYDVAATGEMNLDGTVSAIGGVEQKTYGVRAAGAQVFLVPVDGDNAKDAEKYAGPNVKVIPVTSLGQALRALAALPKR
jgi:PDZ domain-containing protein